MNAGPVILMICMAVLMGCMVLVYERLLEQARHERDEALADADLATDLFMAERVTAQHRHPVNYGGGNLRIVK